MSDEDSLTLKLAKQLGILRTRKVSTFLNSAQQSSKLKRDSPFLYYIVIDFESTCWADKRAGNPSPEIIEFPAVLFDARMRTIPDGNFFQQYVMPTEQPVLSKFCTDLTGIIQEKVDAGCPLPTALFLFNSWIRDVTSKFNLCFNENVEGKNPCAFVTWTDWDLKVCLENECKRKGILKPKILNAWIDLKYIYKKFYNRKPQGLNGALKETGLEFDGREHSGFCDAKNTAKLLGKMLDDSCNLGITKAINGVKIENCLQFDESGCNFGLLSSFLKKNKTESKPGLEKMTNKTETLCNEPSFKPSKETIQPNDTSKKSSENSLKAAKHLTTPLLKPVLKDVTNQQSFTLSLKKPFNQTCFRSTPPLCPCGRRSKRLSVSKPGPNQGRLFFTCSLKNTSSTSKSLGCNFFKWDSPDQGQSPNFNQKSLQPLKNKFPSLDNASKTELSSENGVLWTSFEPENKRIKLHFHTSESSPASTRSPLAEKSQYFGNVPLQKF